MQDGGARWTIRVKRTANFRLFTVLASLAVKSTSNFGTFADIASIAWI